MSRLPDLIRDSRLRTEFRDSLTIHSYLEIDEIGSRFSREEYWKTERFLGRGGFGQVQLERCITTGAKQDSLRVVKVMNKLLDSSGSLDVNRELEAIAKFSNDRYKRWFVKSFGWFEDLTSIFITMEYCCYGDLHHYLKRKRSVPAGEAQQLAYQLLEGLDQMHQNDFAHRDLKPGNILIKSIPPKEKWWIVLADFGISKRADESNGPTTAIKGTVTFMAPELLGYLDQRPKSIADFKAADMWALGEIIFQMLTGETTFQNPRELMTYCIGQREFPSHQLPVTADGREFITCLMMVLPQDRMTTTQCIQHCWMKSLHIEEEFVTLNLKQSSPLVSEISWNELASAQWSSLSESLSDLEHKFTQKTAQWKPARPLHPDSSSVRQTQIESISGSPSIQYYSSTTQDSLILADMVLVHTLKGHSDGVCAVVLSPGGKRMAFTSDETVRLWDTRSRGHLQTLKGHSDTVWALAFSPDSKRLASASKDKTVRLWDAKSGEHMQTLKGHSSSVWAVAFSPDGKRLASASWDQTVRVWDTRSGKHMQTLKRHWQHVWDIAFSPDGKWLACATDNTVRLWDARSGEYVQTLKGHSSSVWAVAFSPDSKRLASASSDYTVRLWDARSGEHVQTLKGHSDRVWAVAFSLDSKRLASASTDKTVRLWDARSGEHVQTLEGHLKRVQAVAFSQDSKRLASASDDKTVRLWDARSGEHVQTLEGHLKRVQAVAFSQDSKRLASVSGDMTVRLWEDVVEKC
ncbi:hypothetical protein GJ744_002701 [Endocarpon pusillum]|uniref:Protein kinase domain-containing protein n=1 Tax=Endocarpon pusillum TaxID=364733 RepID=A0A8H7AMQ5_9EURO|nr:hypothetical protein GJ744_002701 [Endocarpon pusillum]